MDKEQARFILRSFRPDGADAADPEFTEALALAMGNRDLGEWLAGERALDSAFTEALGSVNLPDTLREDIFACLASERVDFPQAENAHDRLWIEAFATIQPPAVLRDRVLAAMDLTAGTQNPVRKPIPFFRRYGIPVAAVAGVALAFLMARPTVTTRAKGPVAIDTVQAGFMKTYESPFFHLEEKRDNKQVLIRHLQERQLPCPGCLPPGLEQLKSIGCRKLEIDGKTGSLLCFRLGQDGIVHMVIFRREDVSGIFPAMENPEFVRSGEWTSARWENGGKVFLMMSETAGSRMADLF